MKRTKFSLLVALLALFTVGSLTYVSCNKEEDRVLPSEKADCQKQPESVMIAKSGGGLGYLDKNNVFRPIADAWLKDYYRSILEVGDRELNDPIIVDETDPETGNPVSYVKTSSADGTLRITGNVEKLGEAKYVLIGLSCSCETESCATTNGCTSSIWGGNCYCSSCEGDCKKSSTSTSMAHIRDFFNRYYAL